MQRSASIAQQIALLPPQQRKWLLHGLDPNVIAHSWRVWARREQIEPEGNWTIWMIKAGRGWGKTRTGAEWIREQAKNKHARLGLIGRTAADIRDVMIEGESGLLSVFPESERPLYEPSKRRLTFKNGAVATCYSADEPSLLRGPQHEYLWCDELAAWRYDRDAWDNAMFGLRLGDHPRVCITTTPRPTTLIRELMKRNDVVVTGGSTHDNSANLAKNFIDNIINKYEGTRLGRQEIDAEILDDNPGALWNWKLIEQHRVKVHPPLRRVVVAIDPAVTSRPDSDEAGIICGGIGDDGHGYVLDDLSGIFPANEWAKRACEWYHAHDADRLVAEVNNGGDLVEMVIRSVDRNIAYKEVRATRGKTIRAEPIAGLYEQGRVHHVGQFPQLEDQMTSFDPQKSQKSPDRMDALVWLMTELMLDTGGSPRIRLL